jgi:YVTN family beta-propeller protein
MQLLPRTCLALFLCFAGIARAQTPPLYRLMGSVDLGAPDRWDYVFFDHSSHHVFVAHGNTVSVVEDHLGKVIGHIDGISGGTHGIAVDAELGLGYTVDGEAGEVEVFDLKSFEVVRSIKGVPQPDGVIRDPASGHIFVMSGDASTVSVIDPHTNDVIATIRGGGKLEAAVADGMGRVFINGAEKRQILRVDTRSNLVTATWPISECESPHGIAIDPKRSRLFTSCVNQRLVVVDSTDGAVLATLPIGKGTDAAAFDPVRRRVFSSNGRDGTLTVIQQGDDDSYKVIGTMNTAITGRTMDIDPATGRIFIAAAEISAASPAANGRPKIVPGSLKLLIFDPE